MFLRMSDEKQTTGEPTVIISTPEGSGEKLKSRLTKKHVLIAVISLLITGLVVTGVLVGIRIFTDSNLEVLKYTMQANGVKQNVSTSENSVIYHVTDDNSDTWIVQNFDTGLQVSKILSDGKTACYVTALNKSGAIPPSSIPTTSPDVKPDSPSSSVIFKVLPDQIPDISYLGKKASTMCQNIPTYHAVPDCGRAMDNNNANSAQNSTAVSDHRSKRVPGLCSYNGGYLCACAACWRVCGIFSSFQYRCVWYGYWQCTLYMNYLYSAQYLGPPPYQCRFNGLYYNP